MPPVVLSVLAHPDDAEFLCAGALIRLGQEHGWKVHIASMTPGDCGSVDRGPEEIAQVRRAEGARAAATIGAVYHCLEERDLLVTYNEVALAKVTQLLRTVQPAEEGNHLASGHVFVQPQLAGQIADMAAGVDAVGPAIVPGDGSAAGAGAQEAEQHADRRRLAGAVGAEDADDLAGADFEVEPIEGREGAVLFRQLFRLQQHGNIQAPG